MKYLSEVILLGFLFTVVRTQTCVSPTSLCTCYVESDTQRKVITCRYKSLTSVPTFTPSTEIYDRIEFTSVESTGTCAPSQPCNNIRDIPADAFQNLKVKEIDLRKNAISSFDVNAFRGLESVLETLLIEGDGVIVPPYSSLTPLRILKSLHLEHFNQAKFNQANTQLSFSTLKSLTIDNFKTLTTLSSQAFQNVSNIETFNLQNMPSLDSLPVLMILSLTQLKTLNIYETAITQLFGESFKGLSNLTSIEIKSNRYLIMITSNAFDGVSNTVKFVSLFQNDLSNLDFLSQTPWPQLTQLNIGYNNIAQVSSGVFSTMPVLNYLTMADMGLQGITRGMFTGLTNLHTLDLGYNSLQNIPADVFQNSPNLVDLRLNNQNENVVNPKLSLDDTAFLSIENSLQHLLLGKNRFDNTQLWNITDKFVNLIELNLADTGISSIPYYAFRNNVKLETIELSENNIKSLQQETFFGPKTTLRLINLYRNKIQSIDKCVLSDFPAQPELYLTGNPLNCDCQLEWLYQWVQTDVNLAYTHVGECSTPAALKGKYFIDFNENALVCPSGYQEPICLDLYATTTTTTTTTTITVSTTPTTETVTIRPTPGFSIDIIHRASTKMTVQWYVLDRTFVTEYKLEIIKDGIKTVQLINKAETEVTLDGLKPETFYRFCLILQIEGEFRESVSEIKCADANTLAATTTTTTTTTTPTVSTTPTTTTVTKRPTPDFTIYIIHIASTKMTVGWSVADRTFVTEYKLEIIKYGDRTVQLINKAETEVTLDGLKPETSYQFCLILQIDGEFRESASNCANANTLSPGSQVNIPVVVG